MELNEKDINLLLKWNREGLIPGPEDDFLSLSKRAEYSLKVKDRLKEEKLEPVSDKELFIEEAFPRLNLYDIAPGWVPLFFSNKALFPWDGGCSLFFKLKENEEDSALIQLRESFYRHKKYFGYEREELIAHELCHVGRIAFHEPQFEELLAWQTSNSPFRKFLGPLFSSQKESAFFAFLLISLILFDLLAFFSSSFELGFFSFYLKILPLIFFLYLSIKLLIKRRYFFKTLANLQRIFKDHKFAVIYRLTDQEIKAFSFISDHNIIDYMMKMREKNLRWALIFLAYAETSKI